MEAAQKYQNKLLETIRAANLTAPISKATEEAYLETPRHLFVSRYRRVGSKDWQEVSEERLAEHLPALYANGPVILVGDEDSEITSTVSQPSLVLRMLDMLQIEPGMKILEVGAGSGWSAALMGRLVGAAGHVFSIEIIPELAKGAASVLKKLGKSNVTVVEGDASVGYAAAAPFDRVVFTAGTYDLPRSFFEQTKEGGLLLVVIKTEGGGDCLFLLRKRGDRFESMESMQVAFVQMTGQCQMDSLEPLYLERFPEWTSLKGNEVSRGPFWWGGKGKETFAWRTWGVRSYLGVTEPLFQTFKTEKAAGAAQEEQFFGLWDKDAGSLAIAKDDELIGYGSLAAKERMEEDLRVWLSLGMPTTASFRLEVYPANADVRRGTRRWVVPRNDSTFVWSLGI